MLTIFIFYMYTDSCFIYFYINHSIPTFMQLMVYRSFIHNQKFDNLKRNLISREKWADCSRDFSSDPLVTEIWKQSCSACSFVRIFFRKVLSKNYELAGLFNFAKWAVTWKFITSFNELTHPSARICVHQDIT